MQQTIPVNDRVIATQVGITPSTGPFTVDFPFFSLADVVVTWLPDGGDVAEVLVRGADYDLVGVATEDGSFSSGTITLVLPHSNGVLTRSGDTTIERLSNFPLQGFFSRLALNAELNRITVVLQEHDGTIRIARTDLESSLHIPLSEADDGLITVAAPKGERAGKILAWDDAGNLIHSENTLADIEGVNVGVFDELYVNVTGDSMSGPLSVPFLTTTNASIASSMQVLPGGTAKAPTPGPNDVSTNLATTAWVVGFLGAQGQGEAIYKFGDSTVSGDPGTGYLDIQPGVGTDRTISMSRLDADGVSRFLTAMQAGDAMVVTNELTPVVNYARYTLISDVIDNGTWVQFTAHLNDSSSPLEAPPHDTRLRVTGFLNTMNGGAAIDGVAAGYGLTGGGSSGTIPIAADPTVLAPLANPVFTGDPRAPTPTVSDNDTSIATTKFVKDQGYASSSLLANYLPLVGGTLSGPLAGTTGAFSGALSGLTVAALNAIAAHYTTAPPTGGTLGYGLMLGNITNFGLTFGAGAPDKAFAKGTIYLRSDGSGQTYVNSDGTGAGWVAVGSGGGSAVHVGTTPPTIPTAGQLWWYTDASVGGGSLYIYYNDAFGAPQWVPASPFVGSAGLAGAQVFLTADLALNATGTVFSVSNTGAIGQAGWIVDVESSASAINTAGNGIIDYGIHDGSSYLVATRISTAAANMRVQTTLSCRAILTGPTTFALRAQDTTNTNSIIATSAGSPFGVTNKSTYIKWTRVG